MTTELQQRNAEFRQFLETLNPAQRRAVDQTEGPVLVVAGPGTGKTHLLTARIGQILLTTDAKAPNVLCLTFTDAGAAAMRNRLVQRISPEAHRVPIYTFHSFCNRVIQDNLEFFGKGQLEPASELERIEFVRDILLKLPAEHPLLEGRKNAFQYEFHVRNLFQNMKKEGWTPGFVIKKTNEFIRNMPENPEFIYQKSGKGYKKGDLKTHRIKETTEKLERLKAAADLFPKYVSMMERAGRYEFEDMLLWVTQAFEKHQALLQNYQERYQYVLVDEFQDTNGAQFHLLNQLLDFWETPNIFIVGDDDQSIYEFQGARLENLREFQHRYQKGLETVVLTDNYRSGQPILDASKRVIDHNMLRAIRLLDGAPEKQLVSARSGPAVAPQLTVYPTRLQEAVDVVRQIEQAISDGTPAPEIAVLYAQHKQANLVVRLLEKNNIPFQLKRPLNLLNQPLIRQIRDLMEYIQDEFSNPFSGEHRLFRLLHAPWWNLEPVQLARVAASRQTRHDETDQEGNYLKMTRVEREQNAKSLRETLLDTEWLGSIPGIDAKAFQRASAALESLISALYESPAPVLMEQMFNQSGALAWALNQPDKSAYIQMLYSFQEFVQQEALRQPRLSLAQCLSLLRSMDDNEISLPLLPGPEAQNGVQLMTAHASKGLEFDLVFMLDCTEDAWDKKSSGKNRQFSLPPTLTLSGEEDETEARRRLFYVAMTRAKQRLHISYAHLKEVNKPLKVSRFIAETGLTAQEASVQSTALTTAQARLLLTAESPNITLPDQQLMDALLSDFRLSISAFNRYLRCPLAFFYDDILKVSGATSESAAFGLAMHGALQQLVLKMKSDKQMAWPTAESLVRWFNKEMERQSSFFNEKNFDQRLKMGREYLRRLHVEQVPYWKKRAIVERRIDRVEWNGVPMTGVLDKIEWYDNGTLRIVDYKTGKPDKNKTAAPNEKQPLGGEYWRQLAFYHILLTQSRLYVEPVGKTAISWLEPDPKGTFQIVEVTFSAEELQLVQGWITSVYDNIQARNFNTGCEDPTCVWCQMHRDRNADVWIADHAEDGLDDSP